MGSNLNYDILTYQEDSYSLKSDMGTISAIKKSSTEKIGFRRFEDGKIFQTSKIGASSVDQLMSESKKWGGAGLPMDYALAKAVAGQKIDAEDYKHQLEHFKQGLEKLRQKYPKFVFKASCQLAQQRTLLKSSYGLDLESAGSTLTWFILFQKKGSGNVFDGYVADVGVGSNIEKMITDSMQYLDVHDNLIDIKEGRYPIIIGDDHESQMAPFKKLTESFLANKYHDGSALFSSKLGEKLFSDKITVCDRAFDLKKNHLNFFDGEGSIRTTDLTMIDQGRFAHVFYDLRFADKYRKQTTGNGLRAYNSGISLVSRGLYFKPGKKSWKDIIKNFDRCIYLNIAAGGDSNDLGEFSTPAQVAYVYERGQLIGLAPQLTIKTSVQKALNEDLIDVSADGMTDNATGGVVISTMDVFKN